MNVYTLFRTPNKSYESFFATTTKNFFLHPNEATEDLHRVEHKKINSTENNTHTHTEGQE